MKRGHFTFYTGLHHPEDAFRFEECMVNIFALMVRCSSFYPKHWMLDSGAFTQINRHGRFIQTPKQYAEQIDRFRYSGSGTMDCAVTQDYMCEEFVLRITGRSVKEHQQMTVDRYVEIKSFTDAYVMPVLQGYHPDEYVECIEMYGDLLVNEMWVGVGSVCKRNANAGSIESVLDAIKKKRPDLKLHGFGIKTNALQSFRVFKLLHSSDSMAWSSAARREGRNGNDYREALAFEKKIQFQPLVNPIRKLSRPVFK